MSLSSSIGSFLTGKWSAVSSFVRDCKAELAADAERRRLTHEVEGILRGETTYPLGVSIEGEPEKMAINPDPANSAFDMLLLRNAWARLCEFDRKHGITDHGIDLAAYGVDPAALDDLRV